MKKKQRGNASLYRTGTKEQGKEKEKTVRRESFGLRTFVPGARNKCPHAEKQLSPRRGDNCFSMRGQLFLTVGTKREHNGDKIPAYWRRNSNKIGIK